MKVLKTNKIIEVITDYISDDGLKFKTSLECQHHERYIKALKYITNIPHCFDIDFNNCSMWFYVTSQNDLNNIINYINEESPFSFYVDTPKFTEIMKNKSGWWGFIPHDGGDCEDWVGLIALDDIICNLNKLIKFTSKHTPNI